MKSGKTWKRTKSWPKGLLQHKGGFFYARVSKGRGTIFHSLETKGLEVAVVLFSEASRLGSDFIAVDNH